MRERERERERIIKKVFCELGDNLNNFLSQKNTKYSNSSREKKSRKPSLLAYSIEYRAEIRDALFKNRPPMSYM